MKRIFTLIFYTLLFNSVCGQAQVNFEWAKSIVGPERSTGTSTVVDNYGNVYTTGYFRGTTDFDPGSGTYNLATMSSYYADTDIFILKLDASGNFAWAKSIGDTAANKPYSISVDVHGNTYIMGNFRGTVDFDPGIGIFNLTAVGSADIFILKLNASGDFVFALSIGGNSYEDGGALTIDTTGNIYITGHFGQTVDFDPGIGVYNLSSGLNGNMFILKLDASGNFMWARNFGGGGAATANSYSIKVDNYENVYVSGIFELGAVDFDPGLGTDSLKAISQNKDVFILKLDGLGNFLWAKQIGGGTTSTTALVVDPSGNAYVTGSFKYTVDFDPGPTTYSLTAGLYFDQFILKLDAFGNFVWVKRMLGTFGYASAGLSIALDVMGDVYTTGYFDGTVDFDPGTGTYYLSSQNRDAFISKLSPTGNFIWAQKFGESFSCYGNSVAIDISQNIYAVGYFDGTVDFDPGIGISNLTTNPTSDDDAFIVKLSQSTTLTSGYPYITLSSGNVNATQSVVINGYNFTPGNKANLIITGPSGFQNTIMVSTTSVGTFTYSYVTNNGMLGGQYTVSAVDSVTGVYAPIKSFVLNSTIATYMKLVVLAPEANDSLFVNDTSQITWTDKLVLGQNYSVTGAQRNYKYTIEFSSNNGINWQTLATKQGWGYINAIVTFHIPVAFSNIGSNCLVRVVDFYNNSNADSSGIFRVINQPSLATNIKAELYWDFSYANQNNALYGVAADGAARIYLVVSKINSGIGASINDVSVQIADAWNNSPTSLGKVMAATQVSAYDNEANAVNSLTATQSTEAFSRFWFWYVAPDDFAGNNPSDANSAYRYVTAHFTINYSNGTSESFDKQIKIVRPPLCFAHGLASDPSTWDNFRHNALGYELDFLNDSRFYTKRAIQLDSKASFNVNAQYLTIGFSNQNSLIFHNSLQGVIRDLRNQGYATNRCDYIAHSMGGCILRYALDHYNNHFYRSGSASNLDYKNYGLGYINKIITINTPHNSSPWADIINRYTPDLTVAMRVALGLDYGSFPNSLPFSFIEMDNFNSLIPTFTAVPAVRDLQIDQSRGGVNFGMTNLKSHLIGSDFFPGVQNTASNTIPQGVINFVDQAAEEVDFLNKFLDLTIAEEQDQQLVSDLIDITTDYSNPVQTALQYMERMADLYNTAMFIPESDLVVGLSSQLADYPRISPNVTIFDNYIGHAFIRPVLNDIDAGNKVNELLNQHISSNEFAIINATSNMVAPIFNNSRSTTVLVSYRDTSKLKILNPISSAQLKTDSIFNIKVSLSDTTNLISWKVSFQNKTYKLSKIAGITELNIQANSNLLDSNYIFAEAFFKRPDTSFFFFDTVLVNITTTSPLIGFSSKQKIIYLNIDQTKTPDYVSYYNGFATAVSNFSQFISANVANTGIVAFNSFRKSFTGLATGETSAIVSYKGLNDTIYFVVGENPLDSLSTGIEEFPTTSIENKQLKLLCYPNPSNQKMIVDFDVATAGDVSIKVYDLLGQEQLTVFEGKSDSGSYHTILDGSKLSNVVYLCELKNGTQRTIKRIVFLK